MFKKTNVQYRSSGILNPLVLSYLEQSEKISPFYTFFPDTNGFRQLLESHPYKDFDRESLSDILLAQSKLVENTSDFSLKKINSLKQKNTFTVTTGHQLCLFTGPLYFIYKLFSTINLAENLKKEFPTYDFVPIYWMASEDHDFEEVSSFNAFGKKIKWESGQKGAVGDFKTESLKELFAAVTEAFGKSENADYLLSLFESAYLKHNTLADATRFLVNALFGEYGIVIADGNDKRFKAQFKTEFKKDILENTPAKFVNTSIQELNKLNFSAQVNPRTINCFYLENNSRKRIELVNNLYSLVGTDKTFSKTEIETIVENHPERLSPNVVLRPVYQQKILPNLSYVGGPGELAYWLEFKSMFEQLDVLFPILMPRNFITVIDKPTKTKIDKLNFLDSDVFKSEQELISSFQVKTNNLFDLNSEKEHAANLYTTITEKINAIDKSLAGSVSAELQKALNGLDLLSGKANKALKQKSEIEINQIKNIKQKLFPNNTPQERYDNFSSLYIKYGARLFDELKNTIDPFLLEVAIFSEE